MTDYRRVLAAIDLAEDAVQVLERAHEIAERQESAELILMHVVEPMPIDAAGEAMLPPATGIETELYENAERRLAELSERLRLGTARRHIALGYTKREILGFAEDNGVDLIVIGSHSRHGLALLLGSTAKAVLNGAPCDVLAVKIR